MLMKGHKPRKVAIVLGLYLDAFTATLDQHSTWTDGAPQDYDLNQSYWMSASSRFEKSSSMIRMSANPEVTIHIQPGNYRSEDGDHGAGIIIDD